mgnify:CR=1 FL=1
MKDGAPLMTAPIPGQSLVSNPGNAAWEQPAEISDPEQALMGHLENINDVDRLEAFIEVIEFGFDIETVVEGYLRSAVMEGIHTIDVSLSVKKPIMSFLGKVMDAVGIEYSMTEADIPKEEIDKSMAEIDKALKAARDGEDKRDVFFEALDDAVEVEGEVSEEKIPLEDTKEPKGKEPKGLMARNG